LSYENKLWNPGKSGPFKSEFSYIKYPISVEMLCGSYYILVSRKASMSQGICNRTVIEHSWVSGEH
jgi:hypothetical protein